VHVNTVATINSLHLAVNLNWRDSFVGFHFMHNSKTTSLTQQLATNWGEKTDAIENFPTCSASVLPSAGKLQSWRHYISLNHCIFSPFFYLSLMMAYNSS
jgi:hypothetical protein